MPVCNQTLQLKLHGVCFLWQHGVGIGCIHTSLDAAAYLLGVEGILVGKGTLRRGTAYIQSVLLELTPNEVLSS